MDEFEIFEQDWAICPYVERSYYEYDTGYSEYECLLWKRQNGQYYSCCGGDINNGCPLSFKYKVEYE